MDPTARVLPLTLSQENILVAAERSRALHRALGTGQYHIVCRMHEPVDETALQMALNIAVQRHEALRTTFHFRDRYVPAERAMYMTFAARTGLFVPGLFVQHIHAAAALELTQRECANGPSTDEQAIWDELDREAEACLDLNVAPTMRAVLVRGGPWTCLILVVTHLTVDGWSLNVLFEELEYLYRTLRDGGDVSLPAPTAQWSDFVVWQREQLLAGLFADDEEYWCRQWDTIQLDGLRSTHIPFAIRQTGHGTRIRVELRRLWLSDDESAAMRTLLKRLRVTPYMMFRTALTALWSQYTGVPQTALWANFANRVMPRSEGMIGWCANTNIVSVDVDRGYSIAQLCEKVSAAIAAARRHESLPLPAVWRRLGRNVNITNTRINCDVFPSRPSDGTAAFEVVMPPTGLPMFDVDLRIANEWGRYGFVALFNAERYKAQGIESLLADVRRLILAASLDPDRPLAGYLDGCRTEVA